MASLSQSFSSPQITPREPSAAAVFLAGLPDHHRGRVLTSGSVVDCHRYKPRAIRERLRGERLAHAWRAAL